MQQSRYNLLVLQLKREWEWLCHGYYISHKHLTGYYCDSISEQSDWTETGISLCSISRDENMPGLADFHQHFDVVFVDPTGYHNLCYAVDKTVFARVST